ncbi:MAG TPA: PTS fructose transporter subunit IIA [Candidatus Olsenella stercoravium]|uniref:PTS fructose transporter subunit IIA n=1 Tax=Candidatus Olsenella stercoravium TaxID=2838713 RepID=A0A9D2DL35_9ACTN|nr:PTS fructose transporter subunit IIA [Candidatus Olsenella stercoravium]
MVGCILTGHGIFAEGVGAALEMVGGPQQDFAVVTFLEEEAGEYPAKISGAIVDMAEKCGEVVVFCDLMGGTPFNQSMMAGATIPGVRVVTGVNLPMLLECMSMRTDATTAEELVQTAVEIGQMGIAAPVLEAAADDEPEDGDGI